MDILTGQRAIHDTRVAVLWDDQYFYVSYGSKSRLFTPSSGKHNDLIYNDNDVEFFIAGPYAYYEFEINAFNTAYEAFFVWKDTFKSRRLSQLAGVRPLQARSVQRRRVYQPSPRRPAWKFQTRVARRKDRGACGRHDQQ